MCRLFNIHSIRRFGGGKKPSKWNSSSTQESLRSRVPAIDLYLTVRRRKTSHNIYIKKKCKFVADLCHSEDISSPLRPWGEAIRACNKGGHGGPPSEICFDICNMLWVCFGPSRKRSTHLTRYPKRGLGRMRCAMIYRLPLRTCRADFYHYSTREIFSH